MTFRVGQKVLCVNDRPPLLWRFFRNHGEKFVKRGRVYTIRCFDLRSFEYVLLDEIVNAPREYLNGTEELAFHCKRFRAVDEPQT